MRFADSVEIVANETVEPLDVQYDKYLDEVEHRTRTLRSVAGRRIDIAQRQERYL